MEPAHDENQADELGELVQKFSKLNKLEIKPKAIMNSELTTTIEVLSDFNEPLISGFSKAFIWAANKIREGEKKFVAFDLKYEPMLTLYKTQVTLEYTNDVGPGEQVPDEVAKEAVSDSELVLDKDGQNQP